MRGSGFIFDYVNVIYYELHKINFKRNSLYIDYPAWINHKKLNKMQKEFRILNHL